MKKRDYKKLKKLSDEELLLREIGEVRLQMRLCGFRMSEAVEKGLVEAEILEMRSLEIRHAYLINEYTALKKRG